MLNLDGVTKNGDEEHRKFLKMAYDWAWENSDDPMTKTATILVKDGKVVACGVNKIPDGVKKLPERLERPLKYKYVTHAERTAYYNAAKAGVKTEGTTAYTWNPDQYEETLRSRNGL